MPEEPVKSGSPINSVECTVNVVDRNTGIKTTKKRACRSQRLTNALAYVREALFKSYITRQRLAYE